MVKGGDVVADVKVELDELSAMAVEVGRAADDLLFPHALTRDCTSELGSPSVAESLSDVSRQLARRVERLVDSLGETARLPRRFVEEMTAADSALATAARGGAGTPPVGGAGEGLR